MNFIGLRKWLLVLPLGVLLGASHVVFSAPGEDYFSGSEVREFIAELVKKDGFSQPELEKLFAGIDHKQNVLDAISRPAEGKAWREYRPIFLTKSRIQQGVAFWKENQEILERAEATYGVPAEIIVAILGVETRYGQNFGSFRVIDALATLGFHYEPRATFFRKELREFLLMAREEKQDPFSMLGSYAGAMGYPQFIPSSFRAYAVDFDGNGRRDFWSGSIDAIGSIGNYLAKNGWQRDGGIVVRTKKAGTATVPLGKIGRKPEWTAADLRARGIEPSPDLPADTRVSVVHLEGAYGDEYWLALHNFHMIMTYNRSQLYAMAVYQLAQEVRKAR